MDVETGVLFMCSAILETVGIAGALGEGYSKPGALHVSMCW